MVQVSNILAVAALVSGALAWDHEAICREYPPSPGECALISYTDLYQMNGGDRKLLIFNDQCHETQNTDWSPQSPGFKATFKLTSGKELVAKTHVVGADAIDTISVTINGNSPGEIFDRGQKSLSEGITVTWYRQVNFHCDA